MTVHIEKHPARSGYILTTEQVVPADIDRVFDFFGDAGNLETLTPDWLHFKILTPLPIEMHAGRLIDYRIKLHGIPIRWRTEIAVWEPNVRFVDQQLKGPYRWWHHTHTFEEVDGGTLCKDRVEYHMLGGALVHKLLVRGDLIRIFEYRQEQMLRAFGGEHVSQPEAESASVV